MGRTAGVGRAAGSAYGGSVPAGATLTNPILSGTLSVPSGADIAIASGGNLSLPSLTSDAAPTIRATDAPTKGLYYRSDQGHLKMASAGDPQDPTTEMIAAPDVVAGTTISHGASKAAQIEIKTKTPTAATVTMTATPNIEAGAFEGQSLLIYIDKDSTGQVTLSDESSVAGSKLRMSAATIGLNARDTAQFFWSVEDDAWVLSGARVNNL